MAWDDFLNGLLGGGDGGGIDFSQFNTDIPIDYSVPDLGLPSNLQNLVNAGIAGGDDSLFGGADTTFYPDVNNLDEMLNAGINPGTDLWLDPEMGKEVSLSDLGDEMKQGGFGGLLSKLLN